GPSCRCLSRLGGSRAMWVTFDRLLQGGRYSGRYVVAKKTGDEPNASTSDARHSSDVESTQCRSSTAMNSGAAEWLRPISSCRTASKKRRLRAPTLKSNDPTAP